MLLWCLLFSIFAAQGDMDHGAPITIYGTGIIKQNGTANMNLQIKIGGRKAGGVTGIPMGGAVPLIGKEQPLQRGELTEEEQQGLAAHNEFRQIHHVSAMTLDRQMCDEAHQYAKRLARMGRLEHSKDRERDGQGENLAMGCSSGASPQTVEQAVNSWYNEVCRPGYSFYTPSFSGGTGHFTQVVWKESIFLGIGQASGEKNGMKCTYTVARYKPAGNIFGEFSENVPKGNFDKESYCASVKRNTVLDKHGKAALLNDSNATMGSAELRGQYEEQ